nr:hypothetical protein CFP56_43274 [Quercus suber]
MNSGFLIPVRFQRMHGKGGKHLLAWLLQPQPLQRHRSRRQRHDSPSPGTASLWEEVLFIARMAYYYRKKPQD